MREMKGSGIEWIGDIPADWEMRKIKQLADPNVENSFVDGDWIESPYIVDSGIRYLTTGNIGDGVFKEQGNGYITLKTFEELACKYAFPGDLIISRLNAPYGRSCILPSNYAEYVVAVDNVILRTQEDKRYICYVSQCDGYKHTVEDDAKGTTMKRISRTNLGNIVMPLPPIQQQHRIADYLDRKCSQIDAIIARQQEVIEKLKAYKLSVITEAVTKSLNPNVPMKDSGVEWIGEIPVHWTIGQLKHYASLRAGLTLGKKYPPNSKLVEVPYLRVANVQGDYVKLDDIADVSVLPEEIEKYSLHKNELLMTEGGDRDKLGRGCIWNGEIQPCLHQNHVFAVTTDTSKLRIEFLNYVTSSNVARVYFDYTAKKTTNLASTNSTVILQFKLPIPPIKEQDSVVSYLETKCTEIDRCLSNTELIISKLQNYKKSLIYEVVTGKKEV